MIEPSSQCHGVGAISLFQRSMEAESFRSPRGHNRSIRISVPRPLDLDRPMLHSLVRTGPTTAATTKSMASLCGFDQSVEDRLIELFRHRSHTFIAILTKEAGRAVVFESRSASLVFVEHDPERCIKSCCQSRVVSFAWRQAHCRSHIATAWRFPERICNQSPCVATEKMTRPASPWISSIRL